jgi:hypothetical protein
MNRVTDQEIWIESEDPLADSAEWSMPLRLVRAVAEGKTADLGRVSPRLADNLETIRDIYAAWIPGHKVPLNFELSSDTAAPRQGVSLFFSCGVDSFYSLIKHRDEVDNLILVHGFDVPLADTETFALIEAQAREVAGIFGKRLVVVRTNVHFEQPRVPGGWGIYHGAAMAAVAHALAPIHSKVYIASSYSYGNLHTWGSHPLLDPLWSTNAVQIVHDGGETRMDKLRELVQHPDAVSRLHVCWENLGRFNCCHCEKCVRTMLGLRALGVEHCDAFPDILTPVLVRSQEIGRHCLNLWLDMLSPNLPPTLFVAAQSAIHSCEAGLPPRTGKWKREVKRWLYAVRNAGKALISPIDPS